MVESGIKHHKPNQTKTSYVYIFVRQKKVFFEKGCVFSDIIQVLSGWPKFVQQYTMYSIILS